MFSSFLEKLKIEREQIIFVSELYDLNFIFHFKVYRQKAVKFINEHLKTFYKVFHVEFYIKLKLKKGKITCCHGKHDANNASLRSVLACIGMLHDETILENIGEGLLHVCISSYRNTKTSII